MNITAARAAAFVRRPDPDLRAILVYGPDQGLVSERAGAIAAAVGAPGDPFSTVELTPAVLRDDPARLLDEAAALTFTGNRRLVRVRDAADALTAVVRTYLEEGRGDALVLLEAGALAKRSTLRGLVEQSRRAAALACYPDEGEALFTLITDTLKAAGVGIAEDAVELFAAHVGADHGATRRELDKLILYMDGPGGESPEKPGGKPGGKPRRVSVDDVRACIGDSAATSLDAVLQATYGGDLRGLDGALQRLLAETQPVMVLRAAARHLQRLLQAAALAASGHGPDKAMDALRPPVFRRDRDGFRRQMRAWPTERLAVAAEILVQAELDCKTTGLPAAAICHRALMRIAQAAASGRTAASPRR